MRSNNRTRERQRNGRLLFLWTLELSIIIIGRLALKLSISESIISSLFSFASQILFSRISGLTQVTRCMHTRPPKAW